MKVFHYFRDRKKKIPHARLPARSSIAPRIAMVLRNFSRFSKTMKNRQYDCSCSQRRIISISVSVQKRRRICSFRRTERSTRCGSLEIVLAMLYRFQFPWNFVSCNTQVEFLARTHVHPLCST